MGSGAVTGHSTLGNGAPEGNRVKWKIDRRLRHRPFGVQRASALPIPRFHPNSLSNLCFPIANLPPCYAYSRPFCARFPAKERRSQPAA